MIGCILGRPSPTHFPTSARTQLRCTPDSSTEIPDGGKAHNNTALFSLFEHSEHEHFEHEQCIQIPGKGWYFLSDPGKPGVRSLGPDVRPSVHDVV